MVVPRRCSVLGRFDLPQEVLFALGRALTRLTTVRLKDYVGAWDDAAL